MAQSGGHEHETLHIAVFASNEASVYAAIIEGLSDLIREYREWSPGINVRVERWKSPDLLLGYSMIVAEIREPGDARPKVAAAAAETCPLRLLAIFRGELYERSAVARLVHWSAAQERFRTRTASTEDLIATGCPLFDVETYLGHPLDARRYPYVAYENRSQRLWIESKGREQAVWVPAEFVGPVVPRHQRLCELTTIGCAAAPDLADAESRAAHELQERHLLRTAWFLGRRPALRQAPQKWRAQFEERDGRVGWRTTFGAYEVPLEGLLVSVVFSEHVEMGVYSIGSAVSRIWDDAADHAFREAIQGRLLAWLYRDRRPPELVTTYHDHMLFHATPTRLSLLRHFFNGSMDARTSSPVADEEATARALSQAAQAMRLASWVTLLDGDPLNVVRCISPLFQPMEAAHAARRLVGRWAEPSAFGQLESSPPHPFG